MIKLLLLLFLVCPTADVSSLLESGSATTVRKQTPAAKQEVKIVSYNIRFRSGNDLKKMISLLHNDPEIGSAAVLGLQEVDRQKKRSGKCNTVKIIAEELGLHYAWAAPPAPEPDDEEDHPERDDGFDAVSVDVGVDTREDGGAGDAVQQRHPIQHHRQMAGGESHSARRLKLMAASGEFTRRTRRRDWR